MIEDNEEDLPAVKVPYKRYNPIPTSKTANTTPASKEEQVNETKK